MAAIQIDHIVKKFGSLRAVDDVSFSVESGEIFGLLGPNGAGKTTTIRIILDIFKPDSGQVSILGGAMSEAKKDRIGYLPEERGLYQDIRLEQALTYLASLKGLTGADARQRLDAYLERFDLNQHRKKKVKELSKGMQQKAQLIVTFAHNPELVIIDEPFSGLDPVNTQMVKDLMREQREKGVTIVMCTHQMNQVEELCDRLVLINQGKAVLYGRLEEIRHQFAGHEVLVKPVGELPIQIPGVVSRESHNGTVLLHLSQDVSPQEVLRGLVESGVGLERFEIAMPTLDQIFIEVVQGEQKVG
ncbi:MAG: ATP-binding cassette domain-containing protein [Anaerolineae bacterium]|nr:ATP-binding cassette domain-containing protein [Anaerolineae bacterium]